MVFPYKEMAGTDLSSYKRGLSSLTPHTPLEGFSHYLVTCTPYGSGARLVLHFLSESSRPRGWRAILDLWYGFVFRLSLYYLFRVRSWLSCYVRSLLSLHQCFTKL